MKANRIKLRDCPKHRFLGGPANIGQRLECLQCGGSMGLLEIAQYVEGYKACGGSVDDIWPGYSLKNFKEAVA